MDFDFEKNGSVSDLNTVPEKFRGLYAETQNENGEKIYAISDGVKPLVEAYLGTNRALNSTRADKKKASDESASRRVALRQFEELVETLGLEVGDDGNVADALKSHIDELTSSAKGGEKLKIDLNKIKQESERRIQEAIAAKDQEIAERDAALSKHLVGDVATRELAAAKGSIELLLPHIKSHSKVVRTENGVYEVRVVDSDGDFRSDGAGGWMGVKDLVAELKANPAFGRAFESDEKGGAGTTPGSTNRIPQNREGEQKSSVDKIAGGLAAGQYTRGQR